MSVLSYKIAILIVPVWWLIFSIPFLKNVHQVHYIEEKPKHIVGEAFRNVGRTFLSICKDKKILCFIIAYFFYIDGVDTIISLATNFGSTLGLDTVGMILALLVTQIVAVPCSIIFGNLSKKVGAIKMITSAVCVYFAITITGFFMGALLDFNSFFGLTNEAALSISQILFWVLATLVGTVQGGIQALSRSFFGQIIPADRSNEYYGFMDIFGKFSCVIGPALYAFVFSSTGKASFGILSVIILFLFGGLALLIGKKYFKDIPAANSIEYPAVEETAVEETAVEEIAVEETAVEEASAEETAVEETAVEEITVEETAVEEATVEEATVEEATVEETAVEETAVEETAVEETAVEETAVEETAVEETAVEEIAVEETAVEEATAEETVSED